MSEQDSLDRLLRDTMGATPVPTLSRDFEQRLQRRLRPRRLTPAGRVLMFIYVLVALVASVGLMRSRAIDWLLIAVAIVVPLVLTAAGWRRRSIPAS